MVSMLLAVLQEAWLAVKGGVLLLVIKLSSNPTGKQLAEHGLCRLNLLKVYVLNLEPSCLLTVSRYRSCCWSCCRGLLRRRSKRESGMRYCNWYCTV
jgi:hypothetical protein